MLNQPATKKAIKATAQLAKKQNTRTNGSSRDEPTRVSKKRRADTANTRHLRHKPPGTGVREDIVTLANIVQDAVLEGARSFNSDESASDLRSLHVDSFYHIT